MEFMTREERSRLMARLDHLKANRPVLAMRIAEARALGDLKENADYHAAREDQAMEEAEVRALEQRLAGAKVLDENAPTADGVVFLGATVRLREVDTGDEDLYRLVGEASPMPPADYVEVTTTSPMGESLMKSRVGEVIRVDAPRKVMRFEIVEIL
ncbi:MAG TPA: transcription elongation factor GreA [Phycisphaerales bacterium]|nr:transcription elongation factor GreA [Phycisphaerales bacterium]